MTTQNLPPGCILSSTGTVVRAVKIPQSNGEYITQFHPVADDLKTAREKRWDFYHPTRGWLLEGYKWQTDPPDWASPGAPDSMSAPSYLTPEEAQVLLKAEG